MTSKSIHKPIKTPKALGILLLLFSIQSQACQFDTDCLPGTRCEKQGSNLFGICSGGMHSGNSFDRQPIRVMGNNLDLYGRSCSWDTDCSASMPMRTCNKDGMNIRGVCK